MRQEWATDLTSSGESSGGFPTLRTWSECGSGEKKTERNIQVEIGRSLKNVEREEREDEREE